MESLRSLFNDDHKKIVTLLNALKKNVNNDEKIKELQLVLHKHFKEEELFYTKNQYMPSPIIPMLKSILDEHTVIRTKLKTLDSFEKITELIKILAKHKKTEEDFLYPELDSAISDVEKDEIYWKIKG